MLGKKQFLINIPMESWLGLKAVTFRDKKSISALLRELIDKHLNEVGTTIFEGWLFMQKERNDPIGDLSRDWINDGMPKPFNRNHLAIKGADQIVINTFEAAKTEWRKENAV